MGCNICTCVIKGFRLLFWSFCRPRRAEDTTCKIICFKAIIISEERGPIFSPLTNHFFPPLHLVKVLITPCRFDFFVWITKQLLHFEELWCEIKAATYKVNWLNSNTIVSTERPWKPPCRKRIQNDTLHFWLKLQFEKKMEL